jgi:hypothetical protein
MVSTICLLWTTASLQAQSNFQTQQTEYKQAEPKIPKRYFVRELSAYAMGGVANISYKLNNGTRSGGVGVGAGLNYAYNINGSVAIVTGLGFATYASELSINSDYTETYPSIDDNGDAFSLTYSLDGEYHEKHSIVLFTIPIMARYSTPLGSSSMKYYASGGFKIGLPLVARATVTPGTVSTSGTYEYEARTYTDLFDHGFVNGHLGDKTDSRIRLGVTPLLSLETGLRIPIGYTTAVTAGLYLDYSLGNAQKSNDKHVLEYQSLLPTQFNYNSVLNTGLVNKVNLFGFGLKVAMSF